MVTCRWPRMAWLTGAVNALSVPATSHTHGNGTLSNMQTSLNSSFYSLSASLSLAHPLPPSSRILMNLFYIHVIYAYVYTEARFSKPSEYPSGHLRLLFDLKCMQGYEGTLIHKYSHIFKPIKSLTPNTRHCLAHQTQSNGIRATCFYGN